MQGGLSSHIFEPRPSVRSRIDRSFGPARFESPGDPD